MNKKIIFHVPHDGTLFPKDLMKSICVPLSTIHKYANDMRDVGVRKLCSKFYGSMAKTSTVITQVKTIVFPISRVLCDVERFVGENEIMEKYGMGFCYERVYDGTKIKNITPKTLDLTLQYYKRHHDKVDLEVIDYHGDVILLDLHSFGENIIVKDTLDRIAKMPDICLGYDDRKSKILSDAFASAFQHNGYSVAENYPYKGSFVPNAVLNGNSPCDMISVMIEVNKAIYIENERVQENKLLKISEIIDSVLQNIL